MNQITYKGPNHWTPPKPTQWQQERKRGPILPMERQKTGWWNFWQND